MVGMVGIRAVGRWFPFQNHRGFLLVLACGNSERLHCFWYPLETGIFDVITLCKTKSGLPQVYLLTDHTFAFLSPPGTQTTHGTVSTAV